MLPNNKVLVFSAYMNSMYNRTPTAPTKIAIIDLTTNTVVQPTDVATDHQMFCEGTSLLADGRLLITGGSYDKGATIYNPYTNQWSKATPMQIRRAYHSSVTLANGKVFVIGGSWNEASGKGATAKLSELYTPSTTGGSWRTLSGVSAVPIMTNDNTRIPTDINNSYRADNHAWIFATGGGNVFHAGPSTTMHWISTDGNGTIASAGARSTNPDAMNGNAVLYDVNKIFTAGDATSYQDSATLQAHQSAYTIDISAGFGKAPVVKQVANMQYRRTFANSVVLPDGTVLVVGGEQHPEPFTDTAGWYAPELWSPTTGQFTALNPESQPRTYHSAAVLLPDARVMTIGGGLCSGWCKVNHASAQIFTPPYLLNAKGSLCARSSITAAPKTATRGSAIAVSVASTKAARGFSLVRISSATHTVNTDQRRIPLTVSAQAGALCTVKLPAQDGVLIPGDYFLYALDEAGTPSVAFIVKVQ